MTIEKPKRLGQSWQNLEWRRVLVAKTDLSARAHLAFGKLRAAACACEPIASMATPAPAPSPEERSCARMTAPYTGDGTPAGGPFVVRPEYRSFA